MPDDPAPQEPTDDQVLTSLWDLAHKYSRRLKNGEVVPLAESEADRATVAPYARCLRTTAQRNLDGLTYRSLSEMQSRRDSRRLLSNLPPRLRLRRLGLELAVRAKPVVFVHARAGLQADALRAAVGYTADEAEPPPDAAARLEQLDDSENRVRVRSLDEAPLERLRGEVKRRLVGQRLGRGQLADTLTSSEADLLSQLLRRREVTLIVRTDGTLDICDGRPPGAPARSVVVLIRPHRQDPEPRG